MTVVSPARNCAHELSLDSRHRRILPSLQPAPSPPRPRRKRKPWTAAAATTSLLRTLSTVLFLLAITHLITPASAAFINFENCLNRSIRYSNNPPLLRFTPMFVWAEFNTSDPNHELNVTIYGNVSGQSTTGNYPHPKDESWGDPNSTFGKIVDVSPSNHKFTTLFSTFQVLTYTAYDSEPMQFCAHTLSGQCPMGPSFEPPANASDPSTLSAFSVTHNFFSTYSFATWASNIRVVSGDKDALEITCVSANITPSLGSTLGNALQYMPAAILALVAIATIFAATCSPWGTSNIFRWTSNYGRDEDLLRLVTPGFGDCLQYIQFIVLAGSLSLNYPGFFQPVVSQASWSLLLFNSSLVSKGNGSSSLVDGIYSVNGTYGLSRLGEYVGMSEEEDIWAGMAVWLLGIVGIVTVLVQLGFLGRWLFRLLTNKQDGDLTGKNWAFTAGNVVRLVFNFFLLPIISISLFQLVVAPRSNGAVVGTAVVLLTGVMGVAVWIFWFIFTTRPRAHLFDDLPTVLMYGPLYNTYSDDAAPFAFIPVLLTTIRGVAIGAIQPSGIAQIIILAICEVILILTLHAFRPFQSNTSMNAYHTFFSTIRLITILLMVSFVPSLGVSEAPKGWIGYVILLLHAIVLVFGFFLNSLQTIIEVAARLTGAGADQRGGLTKVFGKRQLSKRAVHRHQRSSLNSNAAMLAHDEHQKNQLMGGRARSLSGSSAVLLNQPYGGNQRASMGFDGFSQGDSGYGGTSPGTPGTNATPFSILGGGSGQSSRRPTMGAQLDNADPYYRPPRPRKQTMDSNNMPGVQNRGSGGSADLTNTPYADNPDQAETGDLGEASSTWGANRNSITPAFLRMQRDDSDPNLERRNQTDYSVRESDFYYGLRGPALSSQPTRKLKTGPADPMSPVSSATGWFKTLNLFSGKKKEKSKGFEVVRSTRVPPQMMPLEEDDEPPSMPQEPYRDSPDTSPQKLKNSPPRQGPTVAPVPGTARRGEDSDSESTDSDDDYHPGIPRVAERAPTLGPIETGGGIELPSRVGSRASHATRNQGPSRAPTIPRKNSRRTRSTDQAILEGNSRLSTVMDPPVPRQGSSLHPNPSGLPIRLPFGSSEPSPSPEPSPGHSAASSVYRRDDYIADDLAPPQAIQTGERPLSTGYVHQHVTRDSLQNDGYDAGTHLEASAEIVDRSRSISTMQSSRSRRD